MTRYRPGMHDGWAPEVYARFAAQRTAPFDDLLAMLTPAPGGTLVDLGCGTGALTAKAHVALGVAQTLGLDSSPSMLTTAAAPGVTFEQRDLATQLPARAFLLGYVETPMGFAVAAACRVLGVKRTMLRMGRNFSTASNYMEVEGREISPKEVKLRCFVKDGAFSEALNDEQGAIALAGYRQGVLEGVLAVLKVPGTIEVLSGDRKLHDFTFRITWP